MQKRAYPPKLEKNHKKPPLKLIRGGLVALFDSA